MKKIAVFPGSFDPFTLGHYAIVNKALPLFDSIILAIGVNSSKTYFFPLQKRMEALQTLFKNNLKIKVENYEGLTVNFCQKVKAQFILRGLRTAADFEFERTIANMNFEMNNTIETVFFIAEPKHSGISSTVVREILKHKGNVTKFLPKNYPII